MPFTMPEQCKPYILEAIELAKKDMYSKDEVINIIDSVSRDIEWGILNTEPGYGDFDPLKYLKK